MNWKKVRKYGVRGGAGAVAFAIALAAGYLLTPEKVKVINLGGNNPINFEDDADSTYFEKFVDHLKNSADEDSEETIQGLKATFQDVEITWGALDENTNAFKNDVKINGDLLLSMYCLDDLDMTFDFDVDYNGKKLDLALGYVNDDFYFATKGFRVKSYDTSRYELMIYLNQLFFNKENPNGLRIDVDISDMIDALVNGDFLSKASELANKKSDDGSTTSMSFSIKDGTPATDDNGVTTVEDRIIVTKTTNTNAKSVTEDFLNITMGLIGNDETDIFDVSYIDLGTIKLNDITIKGKINFTYDETTNVYPLDDENYCGTKREGFVDMLNYVSWADKLLYFLKGDSAGKTGFNLSASLVGNKTNKVIANVDADVNLSAPGYLPNWSEFAVNGDLLDKISIPDSSESNSSGNNKTNTEIMKEVQEIVDSVLGKIQLGFDATITGPTYSKSVSSENGSTTLMDAISTINFGLQYTDGTGYVTLNSNEDFSEAAMKAKVSTATVDKILEKFPKILDNLANQESGSSSGETSKLFKFITDSDLVKSIKSGDYSEILDVLKTFTNNENEITLVLDLSSLGFGKNSTVTITLDARAENNVLSVNVNNAIFDYSNGATLNLTLNSKNFSTTKIDLAVSDKNNFDDLSYLPSIVEQVADIFEAKQAGFTINGSVVSKKNSLTIDGWGEFNLGDNVKEGWGQITLDQYKGTSTSIYNSHLIKLSVDDSHDDNDVDNAKFTYGASEGIKGTMNISSVLDIMDIFTTFVDTVKEENQMDRFSKFLDPILDLLGMNYVSSALKDKDYVRFGTSEVVKQIKETSSSDGSSVKIVINKIVMNLETDLVLSVNYSGTGDERKIDTISVDNLKYSGKTLNLTLDLVDFASKANPINATTGFIDFNSVKTLLDFGLNTTLQGYYRLNCDLTLDIIFSGFTAFEYDINFYIYVDGKHAYVYGTIPLKHFIGVTSFDSYILFKGREFKSGTTEFLFEPYTGNGNENEDGDDVGGYFHILQSIVYKYGFLTTKTEKNYYVTESKNFIETKNMIYYILCDALGLDEWIYNKISSSMDDEGTGSGGNAPDIENIFYGKGQFTYNDGKEPSWDIDLNLGKLLNTSVLGLLQIDIKTLAELDDDGNPVKGYLKEVNVYTEILSGLLKVNADIQLVNAGAASNAKWPTSIQNKYNTVIGYRTALTAAEVKQYMNQRSTPKTWLVS